MEGLRKLSMRRKMSVASNGEESATGTRRATAITCAVPLCLNVHRYKDGFCEVHRELSTAKVVPPSADELSNIMSGYSSFFETLLEKATEDGFLDESEQTEVALQFVALAEAVTKTASKLLDFTTRIIKIAQIDGSEFTVRVGRDATVLDVKHAVNAAKGYPLGAQCLMTTNSETTNRMKLTDFDVSSGAKLRALNLVIVADPVEQRLRKFAGCSFAYHREYDEAFELDDVSDGNDEVPEPSRPELGDAAEARRVHVDLPEAGPGDTADAAVQQVADGSSSESGSDG
jgi:hypothetical protein